MAIPQPPIPCLPGDVCLYDSPGWIDALIELAGGADVAHIEVMREKTDAGDVFSWACRNGIGVGTYEFRLDGLKYILRHETLLKDFTGFNPAAAQKYFQTVNGDGYNFDMIAGFAKLPELGVSSVNSMICSVFAARLLLFGGLRCFSASVDDRLISPFDFRKTPVLKQVWP